MCVFLFVSVFVCVCVCVCVCVFVWPDKAVQYVSLARRYQKEALSSNREEELGRDVCECVGVCVCV